MPCDCSREHAERHALLATTLMKERVQSATYLVRHVLDPDEINVHLVHLIGDWLLASADLNALKISFRGMKAVVAVTIIVKTAMEQDHSGVPLVPRTFL